MITAFAKKTGRIGGLKTAKTMPVEAQKARSAKGGRNRWAGMTAAERARAMEKVRATRWAKNKRKNKKDSRDS